MIKGQDLNIELKKLDLKISKSSITNSDVVKAITLLIKLARDIRQNQVLMMKERGIDLIKPPKEKRDKDNTEPTKSDTKK